MIRIGSETNSPWSMRRLPAEEIWGKLGGRSRFEAVLELVGPKRSQLIPGQSLPEIALNTEARNGWDRMAGGHAAIHSREPPTLRSITQFTPSIEAKGASASPLPESGDGSFSWWSVMVLL